ncbi:MAG: lamin tail domain-containing protein [Flavobacteriales bacterium]
MDTRRLLHGLTLAVATGLLSLGAQAQVNHLVISQAYGGGGNAGATYNRDFVELFNPTGAAISVTSYSVQYAATAGTSWTSTGALTGSVAAGGYYLIQMTLTGATGAALPTPNFTVSSAIDMAGANGKVALCSSVTVLSGAQTTGSGGAIVDFIGYGTANGAEGSSAAPALSNTTSAFRAGAGCTDTNVNSADFTAGTPAPRNSSTTANYCYATKLVVTTITPNPPSSGSGFNVTVVAQDAGSNLHNVTATTAFSLTTNGNAGVIGGTTTGSITAGSNSITVTGVTLATAGTGVTVTATRTSGDNLSAGTSSTFSVLAGGTPSLNAGTISAGFGNVCVNTPAGPNTFSISGISLTTADVTISCPASQYTFATDAGGPYSNPLNITQPGGTLSSTTIHVLFTPTAVTGYNTNIVVGGGGAANVNVAVTGAGINTAPSVTTGSSSNIGLNAADVAGNIDATGCGSITAYGIEYSTTDGFANGSGTQVAGGTLNVGAYTSNLTGLIACTTYYVKAYATNNGGTTYGAQSSFTTSSIGTPVATAASSVNANGFTANWGAVTGASGYRLDVSTLATFGTTASGSITEGFPNAPTAPSGWTFTGISSYTGGNNSGAASPSLQLSAAGNQVMTPVLPGGATATQLSFWIKAQGNSASTLLVEGKDATNTWSTIESFVPSTTASTKTYNDGGFVANQFVQFRITMSTKVSGSNFALDDVSINYSSFTPSLVSGYNNLAVAGTSQAVTGLTTGTTYYYRVRAVGGACTTANSNTISAVPCAGASISATTGAGTYCSGDVIALGVTVSGTAPFLYEWTGAGTITNDDQANASVTASASGNYHITVVNDCGSAEADVAVLVNTPTTWYDDNGDHDGYGDPNTSVVACTAPSGYVADNTDDCPTVNGRQGDSCNDNNPFTTDDVLNGSCVCAGTPVPSHTWSLKLRTDHGTETTWEIRDLNTNEVIASDGPYGSSGPMEVTTPVTIPDAGHFTLRVLDSGNNGMGADGGYVLYDHNGKRVIDNWGNGGGFTSVSESPEGFTTPVGTDGLTAAQCDNVERLANEMIICNVNPLVSAKWGVGDQTTSGYEFWFFDPNGSYSRHILRPHATSGGYAPADATRAAKLGLASWSVNPLPANTLLNVRVRGRVEGVNLPFGPACRLKVDPVAAECHTTQLENLPGSNLSCGVTGLRTNGSNAIYAKPVRRYIAATNTYVSANRYKFHFENTGEGQHFDIVQSTYPMVIYSNMPFRLGATYDVTVQASMDGGVSYCPVGATCQISFATSNARMEEVAGTSPSDLLLWPNPNRGDELYLSMGQLEGTNGKVTVDVVNMFGERVLGTTVAVNGTSLNTVLSLDKDLASGLYLVNLTAGDRVDRPSGW